MDIGRIRRFYDLYNKSILQGRTDGAQIPFVASKTVAAPKTPAQPYFPRVAPESVGLSSSYIQDFLHALENGRQVHLHRIAVLCDSAVIAEAAHPAYRGLPTWHTCYSMTKSITALAVGILCGQGKLSPSDSVVELLELRRAGKWKTLTVEHLLTMTSGALFCDFFTVVEPNWQTAFFDESPLFAPGSKFFYNSINTYLLGRIVTKLSGLPLPEFIEKHLFAPMDITRFFFECDSMGYAKGGWGLYLEIEDMLKIADLMLHDGSFAGRQLVPAEWIAEMSVHHRDVDPKAGDYDYGYQTWICRKDDAVLFNGIFGQDIWLRPSQNIAVVVTSGNAEIFQQSEMLDIISEYFGHGFTRPTEKLRRQRRAERALRITQAEFFNKRDFVRPTPQKGWRRAASLLPAEHLLWLGSYAMEPSSAGLMPGLLRMIQNCHTAGITRITLREKDGRFFLGVTEGLVTRYLPIGFREYAYTDLRFDDEVYTVGALGEFSTDGDLTHHLDVSLAYIELPYTLKMRFSLSGNTLTLKIEEQPALELGAAIADATQGIPSFLLNVIGKFLPHLHSDNIEAKFAEFCTPRLRGKRTEPKESPHT